eukprot:scaffold399860_cov40-Prasinocladus_malaysianus.AAC.1
MLKLPPYSSGETEFVAATRQTQGGGVEGFRVFVLSTMSASTLLVICPTVATASASGFYMIDRSQLQKFVICGGQYRQNPAVKYDFVKSMSLYRTFFSVSSDAITI